MSSAREKCPDLVVVPYTFEKYATVSDIIYEIFFRYTHIVQSVSCDEVFLEFSMKEVGGDPVCLANQIRRDIFSATKCTASAGMCVYIYVCV